MKPAIQSQHRSHAAPRITTRAGDRGRILYVDSDTARMQRIWKPLTQGGYAVACASEPEAALLALSEDRDIDVIVAHRDLGTATDGPTFLQWTQLTAPYAARIAVVPEGETHAMQWVLASGTAEQVVPSPCRDEDLLRIMERAVERVRTERRIRRALDMRDTRLRALEGQVKQMSRRSETLVAALIRALALKDTETECHSRRVASYARCVGERLGLSGRELIDVELGALLHDVGKIGIPDAILRKPGPLTPDEWVVMRTHPGIGRGLLESIDFLSGAAEIVHQHHERFDGSGYPSRLAGDDICIGARIFSAVDALDVITSERPYKRAQTFEWARGELTRCAGTQFDPEVVEACLSIPVAELREVPVSCADTDQHLPAARLG